MPLVFHSSKTYTVKQESFIRIWIYYYVDERFKCGYTCRFTNKRHMALTRIIGRLVKNRTFYKKRSVKMFPVLDSDQVSMVRITIEDAYVPREELDFMYDVIKQHLDSSHCKVSLIK